MNDVIQSYLVLAPELQQIFCSNLKFTFEIQGAFKTEEEGKERIENLASPKKPPSDRLVVRAGDEPQAAVLKGRVVWGERRMFTDFFR